MNERPHVDYFDGLRIFAALCVIFMHTAAGPLRAGVNTDWHLLNVCTSLAFTAVPLFFMMSGYLLMTSRKTADISVLLRHRLPRLVVPLAGWTVVAVLWQMFLAHTLTPGAIWAQLVTALHGPVMVHFWYLYTLIALYALSPILYGGIQVLGKSGRVYLFVLAAAVSAHTILMTVLPDGAAQYVDLDIFDKLKIFGGHMATFVLGYLLGSYEKETPNWLLALGAHVARVERRGGEHRQRRRAERQQADREPLFFLVVFHGQTSLQEKFLFRPYIITDMQEKCNQKPGAPVGTPGLASKDELHEQHIAHGAGGDAQQCVAPPPVQTRRHADGDDLRHPRPGRCELHPAQAVDQQRDHDGHWQDLAEVLHDLRHGAVAEQQPRQPALQKRARGADRDDGDALSDGEGHACAPPSAYFGASTGRSSVSAATVTSSDGSRNLSGPSSSSAPMLDTAATAAGMRVRAPRN